MTAEVVTGFPDMPDAPGTAEDSWPARAARDGARRRERVPFWRRQLARLDDVHPAAWLTVAAALGFTVIFGHLGVQHYRNFGSWAFDMGIYDQAYWLASRRGGDFITVRGLELWGHHVNPIAYLYAPFYWLGAGPPFLLVSQALVLALGAVPAYLIARDRFASPWTGLAFAVVYLLYAPVQWITWANYHPEALAVTPLLFVWWFARRRYWKAYWVAIVLALSTREDAALVVTMMGVVLAWLHHKRRKTEADGSGWRQGWYTLAVGIVWYAVCTQLIIPHYNPADEPFYITAFYSDYGSTTGEVLGTIARHPSRVVAAATKVDRLRFYRDLTLPLGGMPLLGLPYLVMAAPQMLASVIGSSPYARQIYYQYTAMMIAPLIIAAVEGYALLFRRAAWRKAALVWMLGAAVVSNNAWSPSPFGERYSLWARPIPRHDAMREALRLIPDDAVVSATYALLPHLAQREHIYDWPNPFVPAYWGNMDGKNERLPNPGFIEYLALDRLHVSSEHRVLLDRWFDRDGEFQVLYDTQDVIVARRVRPAGSARSEDTTGPDVGGANTLAPPTTAVFPPPFLAPPPTVQGELTVPTAGFLPVTPQPSAPTTEAPLVDVDPLPAAAPTTLPRPIP